MFTSRLPTSIRRPVASTGGQSTSFVAHNRQSQIPVTVRKANLFTPQSRKPYHSVSSTAAKSQLSATDRKYQRPSKLIPDRDAQNAMFDTLVNFLQANSYPHPLPEAKKFFSSVSTTESSRIFSFLISRILPDFKINRLETDVPDALNQLGYPYIRSVTKSALVSVTTRQAAVGLLVIINWLIKYVSVCEMSLPLEEPDELSDPAEGLNSLALHIILNPELQSTPEKQRVFHRLHPTKDPEAQSNELEKLTSELEEQLQHRDILDQLVQSINCFSDDALKNEAYCDKLQGYNQNLQDRLEESKMNSRTLEIQNEEHVKRLEKVRQLIRSHDISEQEVRAIKDRRDKLQVMKENQKKKMKELSEEICESNLGREKLINFLIEAVEQNRIHMREFLNVMESLRELDSDRLAETKSDMNKLLLELEQLKYDDLVGVQRVQNILSMFFQRIRATHPSLESEFTNKLSEAKLTIEKLESNHELDVKEKLPKLEETIVRTKKRIDSGKLQFTDSLAMIESEKKNVSRRIVEMENRYETLLSQKNSSVQKEQQMLHKDEEERNHFAELDVQRLQSAIQLVRQKKISVTTEAELDIKRVEEINSTVQKNLRTVQEGYTLIKRVLEDQKLLPN